MQELEVGQQVICKHKNGRYYQCEVLELTTATFYEVVFDDGSYSDNLFPEDIEVRKLYLYRWMHATATSSEALSGGVEKHQKTSVLFAVTNRQCSCIDI